MYDSIYPKIEDKCLIPHLSPKVLLEKNYELAGTKLAYK